MPNEFPVKGWGVWHLLRAVPGRRSFIPERQSTEVTSESPFSRMQALAAKMRMLSISLLPADSDVATLVQFVASQPPPYQVSED